MDFERYMRMAIVEAEASLREGNNGFGAVIARDGVVLASSHDRENTLNDPTSHAEMNAIREACGKLGKGQLEGCVLISTHEPCPMCAAAAVWSGVSGIVYGYSIKDSLKQGRRRMDLPCAEVIGRTGAGVSIYEGVLKEECSVLYREEVRNEIGRLRNADAKALEELSADSARRRIKWFCENWSGFEHDSEDPLGSAYRLLLSRLRITPEEAPVVEKNKERIIFHSMNFCPTLEACRILGLDTRVVCKAINERSTDSLLKQLDRRLHFSRNYDKLRPNSEFCEEMICLSD